MLTITESTYNSSAAVREELKSKPDLGMVIYTDGGCRPSRGIGGIGGHGYLYQLDEVKDKANKKTDAPTNIGYLSATDVEENKHVFAVTPIAYIDVIGSLIPEATNNIAELTATLTALTDVIAELPVKRIFILTDSQYVIKGLTEWSGKWEANNWRKDSGEDIPNADIWKLLLAAYRSLKELVEVEFKWVKGHSDELGNNKADDNATKGIIVGRKGVDLKFIQFSDAKGYWDSKLAPNRLIAHPRLYFLTNTPGEHLSKDGRSVYYCGFHTANNDMLAKRAPDHAYSVVFLKEPDAIIERVKQAQEEISDHCYSMVVIGYLDRILSKSTYAEIDAYGSTFLHKPQTANDLYTSKEKSGDWIEPLTYEANPPRLAYRAMETLDVLESLLEEFIVNKSDDLIVTDITDVFYETLETKKKVNTKLLPSISSALNAITVKANYNTSDKIETTDVVLTFNQDIPNRNALSAIAAQNPKVYIVTLRETNVGFRYYTVIKTDDDISIWSSSHSNLKLVS